MLLAGVMLSALVLLRPSPAHAISACTNNEGFAPAKGTVLPPHPRLVYYTGNWRGDIQATINGKKVPTKISRLVSGSSTRVVLVEIDSDLTGTLKIGIDKPTEAYTIKKKVVTPTKLAVTTGRYFHKIPHTSTRELFDGLAIRLPSKTAAIYAHVKLRRDATADWRELDLPIVVDETDKKSTIRVGEIGCTTNYSVSLLEQGIDIEVMVTLADGTAIPVTGLPARVTIPARAKTADANNPLAP